jgi:ADP-heptose:LPS heptosyltransferase
MYRRIVVLNFTRMGDIVQSGPLLRSLKNAHPGSRLTLVVYRTFREAAERLPMVDEVLSFDVDEVVAGLDSKRGDIGKCMTALHTLIEDSGIAGPDLLVNLSHTPLSATLAWLLKPGDVWGMHRTDRGTVAVSGDAFGYLYSIMEDRRWNPFNLVEIYQRVFPAAVRVPYLEFCLTDADRSTARDLLHRAGWTDDQPYCVLQAGASGAARRWPTAAFAEVADGLAAAGYAVILVGAQSEEHLAAEIQRRAQCRVLSLVGQTTVGVLGAVVAGAYRLISNDTGTIHIAAAVGTLSIGLFLGPASVKDTAPYGDGHVMIEPDLACAPCSYQERCSDLRCHRAVQPQQVLRLALAGPDLETVAAPMRGIRVSRTFVQPNGQFELIALNKPKTGPDYSRLQDGRRFWDQLFSSEVPEIWPGSADEFSRLQSILTNAQAWHRSFLAAMHSRRPAAIETALQNSVGWQNQLRALIADYPESSPFARYLLTRATQVRSGHLTAYQQDITEILLQFERGLQAANIARTAAPDKRELDVVAV